MSSAAVTRFAPSPTGLLHLGHGFAARFAFEEARRTGGRFLLRLEDIDSTRVRAEFETALLEDLSWLGLHWEQPVRRQSEHLEDYRAALDRLEALGLLYPCFCTRREIQAEISNAGRAPHGPDGPLYPGTCRGLSAGQRAARIAEGAPFALRLDVSRAAGLAGQLEFVERSEGAVLARPEMFGDVVLARKETPTSYHLSVVVDDAIQGVTLVTRGEDLKPATHLHRLLQHLLDLPVPEWHHHRLITDDAGRRLAKRDAARSIRSLREAGLSAEEVWRQVWRETPT